jgi:CubicO group peptidase (beta-lactamase class C family)
MPSLRSLLPAFCLAFLLASPLHAADLPALDEKSIADLAREALGYWKTPGLAVVIVSDQKELFLQGFGVKEQGKKDPITPDTRFGIGSVTKSITATAMALLVDEGKVSWDDPVRKHVPFFRLADPLADRDVTLRDLFCHRTGLTRHDDLWSRAPWSLEETVRRMAFLQPSSSFRTTYHYNNLAYITLGLALTNASGMPWQDFVKKRLCEPIGMSSVVFNRSAVLATSDHATPHTILNDEARVIEWYPDDKQIRASGSVKTSPRDLGRYLRFHLGDGTWEGKRIVSSANLAEMHRPQTIMRPFPDPVLASDVMQGTYALGWRVYDYRGHLAWSHGGAVDGFRTQVLLFPRAKFGLAVVANSDATELPAALVANLADRLLGLEKKDWNALYETHRKQQRDAARSRQEARAARRVPNTKPSRELSFYAGTYEHPAYGTALVRVKDDALVLAWSSYEMSLRHWHFDTFEVTGVPRFAQEEVLFVLGGDGMPQRFTFLGQEFKRKPKP